MLAAPIKVLIILVLIDIELSSHIINKNSGRHPMTIFAIQLILAKPTLFFVRVAFVIKLTVKGSSLPMTLGDFISYLFHSFFKSLPDIHLIFYSFNNTADSAILLNAKLYPHLIQGVIS